MTLPLMKEIARRLNQIEVNKTFYGPDYHDYGLLLCHANGDQLEPRILDKWFKKWQRREQYANLLDFQGVRKSAQMHKRRLEPEPAVKATGGRSDEVLERHYNEKLERDKAILIQRVERDFYIRKDYTEKEWQERQAQEVDSISKTLMNNPEMFQQVMQYFGLDARSAQQGTV